ncbi:MAG: nuclear transport factor 2 family protein [Gammaproteobacteria bacterium]|nr:nuclear transport factor 2 family protein [Gammaproteobacteria bacterium]
MDNLAIQASKDTQTILNPSNPKDIIGTGIRETVRPHLWYQLFGIFLLIFSSLSSFSVSADSFSKFSWSDDDSGNSHYKQTLRIHKLLGDYGKYWGNLDSAAVTSLYTEDAMFFAPGASPFVGHTSIDALVRLLMDSGINNVSLVGDEIKVFEHSHTAYVLGHYELYAGGSTVGQGPFMLLLNYQNSEWKIHRDIFNSSVAE